MISVTTPSVRPELIDMVGRCLNRQTHKDFEWLVGTAERCITEMKEACKPFEFCKVLQEPQKREGDYYNLNKCWNMLFSEAKGDLIVNIVDGLWFDPFTLENLWNHYEEDHKSCITCVGDQFNRVENGRPEGLVWKDPRRRGDFGSYYEVRESEMELCIASIPRRALIDIGGFEEEFDRGAAVSEKEAMSRAYRAGYKLYISQSIEYRATQHPRLSSSWDEHYNISCDLMDEYRPQINAGTRIKLDYLKK